MPTTGLPDLVAQAYEAACDSAAMVDFVADIGRYFDTPKAAITLWPQANPEHIMPITSGVEADSIRSLFARRHEPGTLFHRLCAASIGATFAMPAPPELTNGEDVGASTVLAGVVTIDENNYLCIILARDSRRYPFSPSEHDTLQMLMSYYRRAVDLNKRFVRIFRGQKMALSVLDNAPRGIFILGQLGQVTYRNPEAQKLLTKDDGISLDNGRFRVDDTHVSEKVAEFIEQSRSGPSDVTRRLMMIVPRRSQAPPYKLLVYTLPFDVSKARFDVEEQLAVALVYDPATTIALNESLLQSFYNLTHAETALAQHLFAGRSLPEASADLGISVNTTRTQLRSMFKKVGVKSQATLLQEFARSFFTS